MKTQARYLRARFLLPGVLLSACWGVAAGAAEAFVIAKGGQAQASLVLLPNSGKMAEQAVGDLGSVLKTMTGSSFSRSSETGAAACVVVGLASEWARLTGDDAPLKRLAGAAPESFLLRSSATRLLILGRDSSGASHGVYTVLRDLGCRWYFIAREWDVVPRRADVAVAADRVEGPALRVRILSNGAGAGASARLFENWCRRNRLGSAYGAQAVSHSYASYVPKALFKEHPEYFAWVSKDGESKGTEQNGEQPCTTHPEVIRRVKEGVLAALRKRTELAGTPPPLVSVSPNDGTPNMCRCERCMAVGTYGDCALLLANQAAEAIHAEFPDTLVGFLAYGRASAPPVNVRQAHPNVLASVAAGFNWKTSVPRLIEEWPKVARHVTVYEYYAIGSWGAQAPDNSLPTVEYISQTIRDWHRRGIEGVNGEMENDWASCGHRLWAFAQFAWDPALTPGAVMNDFLGNCWGPAAGPMRRYYGRWESGQKASPRVLRLALRDLEEASRLASSPEVARRVDQMSLYLYWHLLNRAFDAAKDEQEKNAIGLEGDLFQYRWREAFMVQLIGSLFSVDRPARIGFTPAEVAALRASAIPRFLPASGPDVDLDGRVWSDNLVLLPDALKRESGRIGEEERVCVGAASYCFRAQAGEEVRVVFEPSGSAKAGGNASARPVPAAAADVARDPVPMADGAGEKMGRFQVWYLGGAGTEQEFVTERNPPPSDGQPLQFAFKAPRDGLYRLNIRMQQGGVRADFGGRPHVLAAEVKARKNVLRLDPVEDPGTSRARAGTRYYFHVPGGVRWFLIAAASPGRKEVKIAFDAPAGERIKEVPVTSGEECLVEVPAGRDGTVWCLSTESERLQLGLGGIPPWVATRPGNLLVPNEALPATSRGGP